MRVLFAVAEVTPFSKAGGLADVAGALPAELARMGLKMVVISPLYSLVRERGTGLNFAGISGTVLMGKRSYGYKVHRVSTVEEVTLDYLFVQNSEFYDRPGIYAQPDGTGFADSNARFFFFQRVLVDLIGKGDLDPEIVHLNDHHTALLPLLLANRGIRARTLLTVHNFEYQGSFSPKELSLLEERDRSQIRRLYPRRPGESYNALEIGLRQAHRVNTVSPSHASELLKTEGHSFGLFNVLTSIKSRFSGILNGADYSIWNPSLDPYLDIRYDVDSLDGKTRNKSKLLKECGLPDRLDDPLMGSVSRLVESKGFHLVLGIAEKLIQWDIRMVFLGTGDEIIKERLEALANRYPGHVAFHHGFDEDLAHQIEAGADMFMMPSEFEPCGLNQIYSLRYGTIPIVHETGGLADTVDNWNGSKGNGFVFKRYTERAFLRAVGKAIKAYRQPSVWRRIMRNAMKEDFSWFRAAMHYRELYSVLLSEEGDS
ncbi:MAG: glycogen synthase [Candidatus Neomarinimicrobiota bacterium]